MTEYQTNTMSLCLVMVMFRSHWQCHMCGHHGGGGGHGGARVGGDWQRGQEDQGVGHYTERDGGQFA